MMTKQLTRRYACRDCGGTNALTLSRWVGKVELPVRDDYGRFIFDSKYDPESKQTFERQRMREVKVEGLGKWRCHSKECKGEKVKVDFELIERELKVRSKEASVTL